MTFLLLLKSTNRFLNYKESNQLIKFVTELVNHVEKIYSYFVELFNNKILFYSNSYFETFY